MTSPVAAPPRLAAQLAFATELDRLKGILRQTIRVDASRHENSAEHSWHLAAMAPLFAEYAEPGTDIARVVAMVLVHDVVEIDAGDTFCYDAVGNLDKAERETRAADRLFGMLPPEQGAELRAMWDEFEAGESREARYAHALDRLQPLLLNFHSGGLNWSRHGVRHAQARERMDPIRVALPALWPTVLRMLDDAAAAGWLAA